ncbi:MAG: hypothetical protein ABW219_00375 [Ilumatobacteraceae bacterium]
MLIDTSIHARRRRRGGGAVVPTLACAVVVGMTACHEPVRTDSSSAHLSAPEQDVACRLYRELREVQGEAFEQRLQDRLGDRLDEC